MKILTIGASPYLLTRNGKMHADIIKRLHADKLLVASAVWHHDDGYFMPDEEGVHYYEQDEQKICKLFPFNPKSNEASPFIYELMKASQPTIVVTIGDYKDTNFLYAIKAMYPTLFKWVAIYTIDSNCVNSQQKDAFEYADLCICPNEFGYKELQKIANVNSKYIPYGPNHKEFYREESIKKDDIFLCSSKNAQASNIAAFIKSVGNTYIKSKLHTNIYDPGDYNIDLLVERYHSQSMLLPTDFVSLKEGLTIPQMREMYNNAMCIVDCSIKSATGLTVLEAMSCGCIPIGMNYGRVGEIIKAMPEEFQHFVPYNIFIGQNEEEFAVISIEGLISKMLEIENRYYNPQQRQRAMQAAIEVASKYSSECFLQEFVVNLHSIESSPNFLAVDQLQ